MAAPPMAGQSIVHHMALTRLGRTEIAKFGDSPIEAFVLTYNEWIRIEFGVLKFVQPYQPVSRMSLIGLVAETSLRFSLFSTNS